MSLFIRAIGVVLVSIVGALFVSAQVAAQGGQGGSVTLPIVDDPVFNQLHPNAYVESVMVNRVLFNGLVKLGKDFSPAPDLAQNWEASDDGLTWTFELRQDAAWHDGEPFTADDVLFTFNDVILNPEVGANNSSTYADVDEVVKVDDYTVEFQLSRPFASLPMFLGYNTPILPEHVLSGTDVMQNTEFNRRNPVGTGPFKFASYQPGESLRLVRNDDYFMGPPQLDEVVYRIVPDPNVQLAQLQAGELDVLIVDNPINAPRLEGHPDLRIMTSNQLNYVWAGPNLSREPFDRAELRQALSYALDREALVENIIQGFGQPAVGPISPVLQQYFNPDVKTYPHDPERSRELLLEAGFEFADDGTAHYGGEPFSFTITYPNVQIFGQLATLVQQYYADIGIETRLNGLEFNTFVSEALVPRDFDMLLGWWVTPPDPDIFPYYHSSAAEAGNNPVMYRSPDADALLTRGREVADPEARAAIYHELLEILAEEVPYIYLWYPDEIQALNVRLNGVPEDIGYRPALQYIYEWYLE